MNRKLYRSNQRILTGVLGGIAEYFGWDATWVRLLYAAITIFSVFFPGIFFYIVATLIIPDQPNRRNIDADEYDSKN